MGIVGDGMRDLERRLSGRAQAEAHPGVSDSPDLDRIIALPRRPPPLGPLLPSVLEASVAPLLPGGANDLTGMFALPAGTMHLRPAQNAMLWEAMRAGGLIGAVGVGHGKTLTSLLLPDVLAAERPLLLIPAQMREQLFADHARYGQHFNLPPILEPHQLVGVVWPPGVLCIASYEELSSRLTGDLLERLRPDLIVCDEAHALRHRTSARSRRFLRYARANPHVRYVFLSGTITSKSIRDYGHLCELALGAGSPTPRSWYELRDWGDALDVVPNPIPPGALSRLCSAGGTHVHTTACARAGYKRRLHDTPGIIISHNVDCDASLLIRGVRPAPPAALAARLTSVRDTWALGVEEFETAMEMAQALRQLATGFYYEWDWPNGPDEEWLAARSGWSCAMRRFLLQTNMPGLDSPALVTLATAANRLPHLRAEWDAWDGVRQRPIPPRRTVWVDEYLVDFAVDWASQRIARGERGIIWYEHEAFGAALAARGLPVYGAGKANGAALLLATAPVICCSGPAHGQGKNLQGWSWNLIVAPMASGSAWEQRLGRTHRSGQTEDEVTTDVCLQTPENEDALRAALRDAEYIEQTTGLQQRLRIATKVKCV